MKKLIVLIISILFVQLLASSQTCLPEGIIFNTQAQIDSFSMLYPNCYEIEGDVTISGEDITNADSLNQINSIDGDLIIGGFNNVPNPQLISFTGLENLYSVGGSVSISWNDSLRSMQGLDNLVYIGEGLGIAHNPLFDNLNGLNNLDSIKGPLYIGNNDSLTSIQGMNNLVYAGALHIGNGIFGLVNYSLIDISGFVSLNRIEDNLWLDRNAVLEDIDGLSNLNYVGGDLQIGSLYGGGLIGGNPSLKNLEGLSNLSYIGESITIWANDSLVDLNGLDNIDSVKHLYITENSSLIDLTGLENLTYIEDLHINGNDSLTSLSGLENVPVIGGELHISNNPELSTCDEPWLCDYLESPNGEVNIYHNATGCKSVFELANNCGSIPCLPYGNYGFCSQWDVDNFQNVFPNCDTLKGGVGIMGTEGNEITNLNGLNQVTTIIEGMMTYGGGLGIHNQDSLTNLTGLNNLTNIAGSVEIYTNSSLTSLTGLENLTFIGGRLDIAGNDSLTSLTGLTNLINVGDFLSIIGNNSLTSLSGLEMLTSIGGILRISHNESLIDLIGIDNIDANTISDLDINDNVVLSTCEVESICSYLEAPNGDVYIAFNATGCYNQGEVEEACKTVSFDENSLSYLTIKPNPFAASTTIEYTINYPQKVNILFYNLHGKEVSRIEQKQLAGTHQVVWAPELPGGVYFFRLEGEGLVVSGKVVLVR